MQLIKQGQTAPLPTPGGGGSGQNILPYAPKISSAPPVTSPSIAFMVDQIPVQKAQPTKPEMSALEEIGKSAKATAKLMWDEEMSFSSNLNEEHRQERNTLIEKTIAEGNPDNMPPEHLIDYAMTTKDYDMLADYMHNDMGMTNISTNEMLVAEKRAKLTEQRIKTSEFMEGTSWVGKTTALVTGIAVSMADPIYLPSLAFAGAGAVRGVKAAVNIAKVATGEGILEAGKQIKIYDHKKEIGVKHNPIDAIKEVGYTVGLTSILGVASHAIGAKYRKARIEAEKSGKVPVWLSTKMKDVEAELSVPDKPGDDAIATAVGKDTQEMKQNTNESRSKTSMDEDQMPAPEDNPEANAQLDAKLKGRKKTTEFEAAETDYKNLSDCDGTQVPSGEGE